MLKSKLAATLRDSVIDPRKDTSYRFVVELDNPAYCITKALDILTGIDLNKTNTKVNDASLKQAITLLAMARCINGSSNTRQTDLPRQPKNSVDGND
jgi:hypothetical protein